MRHIFQFSGGITVAVLNMESRLEVVLHAMGEERFDAAWQVAIVTLMSEFRPQIGLVESSIIAHTIDERYVVGTDADVAALRHRAEAQ